VAVPGVEAEAGSVAVAVVVPEETVAVVGRVALE
jgi:hypothetical protein